MKSRGSGILLQLHILSVNCNRQTDVRAASIAGAEHVESQKHGSCPSAAHQPHCCPALHDLSSSKPQHLSVLPCFARVLSTPSLLIHFNLTPNPDSKITSSILSSLICYVKQNSTCYRPASLQTLPSAQPFQGSSLGWRHKKICPNNPAIF